MPRKFLPNQCNLPLKCHVLRQRRRRLRFRTIEEIIEPGRGRFDAATLHHGLTHWKKDRVAAWFLRRMSPQARAFLFSLLRHEEKDEA